MAGGQDLEGVISGEGEPGIGVLEPSESAAGLLNGEDEGGSEMVSVRGGSTKVALARNWWSGWGYGRKKDGEKKRGRG